MNQLSYSRITGLVGLRFSASASTSSIWLMNLPMSASSRLAGVRKEYTRLLCRLDVAKKILYESVVDERWRQAPQSR